MTKDHIALFGPDGEIRAGHYIATPTVDSARRNLFFSMPGKERHLATIVSGSRSKLLQFDLDVKRMCAALAAFDSWTEIPGVERPGRAADACRLLIEAYMHNPEQVDWSDIQIALDAALEAFGLPEDYPEKAFAAQREELS
ncbi:hypothetical protein [Shinella sp.]|uniref:hypothetical protein n=1 Tax=Shinella sp. TaxID=1870904 RepID=UPI0039E22B06